MKRKIVAFDQDQVGDWRAVLACGHRQHVRHNPPLANRPWVLTEAGRNQFLGYALNCKLCEEDGAVQGPFNMLLTEELVTTALKEVIDPELGINIVDLGLIYDLQIDDEGHINIVMTLTTPGCPMHASFKRDIEETLWRTLPELQGVSVDLVWSPPWTPDLITPEGRAELGFY